MKLITQLLLLGLILYLFSPLTLAQKSFIKCWKNSEGLTECGNKVPREYYSQKVRYIDEQGITRKVKERAKTKEERDAELEIKKLKELEESQKRKSAEYDDVLLKTYLTIDDLLSSLNNKLSILESRVNVLKSTSELRKRQFGSLVREAANLERSGKEISKPLQKKLTAARKELKNLQSQIETGSKEQEQIKTTFAHDVQRFLITKSKKLKYSLSTPSQSKKLNATRLTCLSKPQCQTHWANAKNFIEEFATTKILYTTESIIVTDIPTKVQDIAMSITLLNTDKEEQQEILLRIRCNQDKEGQKFCESDEIDGLIKEFRSFVYKTEN